MSYTRIKTQVWNLKMLPDSGQPERIAPKSFNACTKASTDSNHPFLSIYLQGGRTISQSYSAMNHERARNEW